MSRPVWIQLIACVVAFSGILAGVSVAETTGRAADHIDAARYPNVHRYFQSIDLTLYKRGPMAETNRWWCPADERLEMPQEALEDFLRAAVKDRLTVIRWLGLMSRVLHAERLALCASGDPLNAAIKKLNLELGLSLPLREMGGYAWLPQYDPRDPGKLMRLNLIYRTPYTHRFAKEILPVDLRMGYGDEVRFLDGDVERDGYLTSMDFYLSEERVGFDNISGMGVRRQGFIGILQQIFFFLPDDVSGMYVENNQLVAKALMTMRVPNFETTPKYQMRVRKSSTETCEEC